MNLFPNKNSKKEKLQITETIKSRNKKMLDFKTKRNPKLIIAI